MAGGSGRWTKGKGGLFTGSLPSVPGAVAARVSTAAPGAGGSARVYRLQNRQIAGRPSAVGALAATGLVARGGARLPITGTYNGRPAQAKSTNIRYVSRYHAVTRGARIVAGPVGATPFGRAHSAFVARRAGRAGVLPKRGYVVVYGAKP